MEIYTSLRFLFAHHLQLFPRQDEVTQSSRARHLVGCLRALFREVGSNLVDWMVMTRIPSHFLYRKPKGGPNRLYLVVVLALVLKRTGYGD